MAALVKPVTPNRHMFDMNTSQQQPGAIILTLVTPSLPGTCVVLASAVSPTVRLLRVRPSRLENASKLHYHYSCVWNRRWQIQELQITWQRLWMYLQILSLLPGGKCTHAGQLLRWSSVACKVDWFNHHLPLPDVFFFCFWKPSLDLNYISFFTGLHWMFANATVQ